MIDRRLSDSVPLQPFDSRLRSGQRQSPWLGRTAGGRLQAQIDGAASCARPSARGLGRVPASVNRNPTVPAESTSTWPRRGTKAGLDPTLARPGGEAALPSLQEAITAELPPLDQLERDLAGAVASIMIALGFPAPSGTTPSDPSVRP